MRRRGLLQGGTRAAGVLAAGSLPYGIARPLAPATAEAAPHTRLRPPGALADEADFAAACIGCGLCVEVCPHPSLPIRIVNRSQGAVARHRG